MSTNPPTLTREQFGEGVKGAARTAGYLADNGVDSRHVGADLVVKELDSVGEGFGGFVGFVGFGR